MSPRVNNAIAASLGVVVWAAILFLTIQSKGVLS